MGFDAECSFVACEDDDATAAIRYRFLSYSLCFVAPSDPILVAVATAVARVTGYADASTLILSWVYVCTLGISWDGIPDIKLLPKNIFNHWRFVS